MTWCGFVGQRWLGIHVTICVCVSTSWQPIYKRYDDDALFHINATVGVVPNVGGNNRTICRDARRDDINVSRGSAGHLCSNFTETFDILELGSTHREAFRYDMLNLSHCIHVYFYMHDL